MSRKEFAKFIGISIPTIATAEKKGLFFSADTSGVRTQLKFNKVVPKELRGERHLYNRVGATRQNMRVIPDHCTYCGKVVLQLIHNRKRGRQPFCNHSCSQLWRFHGPKPIEATTNQISPEVVAKLQPNARDTSKTNKWVKMEEILKRKRDEK